MEFKRLSDVEVVAEPTESANVLIEENGVIKKAPKTAVGGADGWDAVIEYYNVEEDLRINFISGDYNTIYKKIMIEREIPKIKVISVCESYGLNYTVSSADAVYVKDGEEDGWIAIMYKSYYDNRYEKILRVYTDNSIEG